MTFEYVDCRYKLLDGFHLHLLVFPLIYQLLSVHHLQMTSSEGFQHHFGIISNSFVVIVTWKKNVSFTLISFVVLKWDDFLSVQVPFELPVQILVQLLIELEANWIDQNVNELEFEPSRMNVDETTHYIYNCTYPMFDNVINYADSVT